MKITLEAAGKTETYETNQFILCTEDGEKLSINQYCNSRFKLAAVMYLGNQAFTQDIKSFDDKGLGKV